MVLEKKLKLSKIPKGSYFALHCDSKGENTQDVQIIGFLGKGMAFLKEMLEVFENQTCDKIAAERG